VGHIGDTAEYRDIVFALRALCGEEGVERVSRIQKKQKEGSKGKA